MRIRRNKPVTQDAAEQLLDGETTSLPTVSRLLSAATPPEATPGTVLPGEAQALAAFRHAQATPPARSAKLRAARAAVVTALSTKVVLAIGAAAAVAATGAVAVTSTDILTGPSPARPTATSPSAPPSAATTGLCTAFEAAAKAAGDPVRAARQPAFAALVAAAGGLDRVADYCAGQAPTGRPTGKPSDLPTPASPDRSGKPSDLPTPASPDRSGKPTDLPTPAPVQPSRRPTDLPTADPAQPSGKPSEVPAARP